MSEIPTGLKERLTELAGLLRKADHLEPESQAELASLLEELGDAVETGGVPLEEVQRLHESADHVEQALAEQGESTLGAARRQVTETMTAFEVELPFIAGILRRITDALARLGI